MFSTTEPDTPLAAFQTVLARQPDAPAILQGDEVTTFAELDRLARALVTELGGCGVEPQTGVVIAMDNGPMVASAVLASWRLSAYPVFVSPNAPADHLDTARQLTSAVVMVTAETPHVAAAADGLASKAAAPDEIWSVVFTSGSTGTPKGVIQSGANLLSGARRVGRLNGYDAGDRILCPVPFSHDYGWGQLLSCLCLGTTLVLPVGTGLSGICDAIERHRPTVFAGTPAVFAGLVHGISDIRATDRASIVKATSTGAQLSPSLAKGMEDLFPGLRIYANYGLTETYRSACLLPDERTGREQSVGRAIEGVRLVVVDDQSRILPPGSEGEVVHIGAGACLGYIGDPDRTASLLRPLYDGDDRLAGIHTGDFGVMDAEGFLTLSGRRDRLIKTMDVRISLDSVERTLESSGMVERAAAIDVAERIMGRKIVAIVVMREGSSIDDLKVWARANMPKFNLPRAFHVLDAMPLTVSGKTSYAELKRMFGDDRRA